MAPISALFYHCAMNDGDTMKKTSYVSCTIFLLVVIILMLTGCSNIKKQRVVKNPDELVSREIFQDQLSNVLQDYADIEQQSDIELELTFNTVKQKFETNDNLDNRIRYILLLVLTEQKFSDLEKAYSLLNDWPENEYLSTPLNSFRDILIMRLEAELRLRKVVNQLSNQLANEKLKSEMLQKKINDIKDMEKSLIRRNMP
ncbi:MAG: hypothetical protein H6940_13290 [Burkholderiales bacterium]|nr:hypothetical protein [Burkholderiales bacterium]